MPQAVEDVPFASITRDHLAGIHRLVDAVWPTPRPFDDQVDERLADAHRADDATCSRRRAHVVRRDGRVLAVAVSFVRVIADARGRTLPVLALASVCADPADRGHGLGASVVRAAFARVPGDAPVCFFQTAIPDFYRRLGARVVGNEVINSVSAAAPRWDPHLMIWPAQPGIAWPEGRLDLRGPGW
jgi:predicted N-acetyltransferase YhbS